MPSGSSQPPEVALADPHPDAATVRDAGERVAAYERQEQLLKALPTSPGANADARGRSPSTSPRLPPPVS